MRIYKEKECIMCGETFIPTSPKQKFCKNCKENAARLAQKKRDKRRNRLKYNTCFVRKCPMCGTDFQTYDSKKIYCGSENCEALRKKKNRVKVDTRRSKERSILSKTQRFRKQGEVLKQIKTYLYNEGYTLVSAKKYKNTHDSKLTVICPMGHEWVTTFHNFKDNNNRCATCYHQNNYVSKPEQLVRDFLEAEFSGLKVEYNNRDILSPKELDLYFPDYNLAIEICGLYWHGESSGKSRDYHYQKMMDCFNKNIRLITIFEDELYNKSEIVFSRIRQALGKPCRRIFARKCILKEIDSKTANTFYKNNHIQGRSTAVIRYGLYYNSELVCVGSLGKFTRKHTGSGTSLELKRFCTLYGVSVVGGVGKIFKAMRNYASENGYSEIKSYCDMRYANIFKPVYEVLGFTLVKATKYTPHYFKSGKRYRNYSLRKTASERLTGKTEWELRQAQGYDRIWDCGHRTYVYKIN